MRQHKVQGRRDRQWAQRLHRHRIAQVCKNGERIAEVGDLQIGKARIAVKGRDHDIAEACQPRQDDEVIARERTAGQSVREGKNRVAD